MTNLILSKIKEYSISQGTQIAFSFLDRQVNWKELENKTNWIAYCLQSKYNIKKQTPILIYHARGIEFIEYMIAVLKCGCYYIPLEYSTPIERVKYIYDDVCAGLIITDRPDCFCRDVYTTASLDNLLGCSNQKPNYIDINESDLIYVIYTSGTTGKPKGVKIMYSNLINLVKAFSHIMYAGFYQLNKVVVGVLASFSFDASVKQIYCSLYYGHTLCIADGAIRNFGRKLHNFHVENNLTVCDITPSHLILT